MSTTLQFIRDTTANIALMTGADGELFVDENKKTIVINDGATVGGFPLPTANDLIPINANVTSLAGLNAGINTTQNTNITLVNQFTQSAYNRANTSISYIDSNTSILSGINLTQNTNIQAVNTYSISAYSQANTATINAAAASALAQGAYDLANTKFGAVGGTFTGAVAFNAPISIVSTLETMNTISSPGQTVTLDLNRASIFYLTGLSSHITASFQNATLASGTVIGTVINIVQGSTPYIANAVSINGVEKTINWLANTVPTGTANSNDVISFSFLVTSNTANVTVLGSLNSYG